jgi:hypothetical protein
MTDVFESLGIGFNEIARYMIAGVVTVVAVLFATGTGFSDVNKWILGHRWILETAPAVSILIIPPIVGYLVYHLYRGFVYELCMLVGRDALHRRFRIYIHRDYIHDIVKETIGKDLSTLEVQQLYSLMRSSGPIAAFYEQYGSTLTTSIHILYYTDFLLFVGALFRWVTLPDHSGACGLLFFILVLCAVFVLMLFVDCHFEKIELLLYAQNKSELTNTILALNAAGAWGPKTAHPGLAPPSKED